MGPRFCDGQFVGVGKRRVDGAYRAEAEGVDFDTESGNVLLLELSRQMALDEGSLEVRGVRLAGAPTRASLICLLWPLKECFRLLLLDIPFRYRHHRQGPA